jgi:small subunit ribosomal protein S6
MVVIVRPETSDDDVEVVLEGIKSIITAKGGAVEEVNMWGKRKLAYPIKHATEGIYALLHFMAVPSTNKEIDDSLHISEKVLRHIIMLAQS